MLPPPAERNPLTEGYRIWPPEAPIAILGENRRFALLATASNLRWRARSRPRLSAQAFGNPTIGKWECAANFTIFICHGSSSAGSFGSKIPVARPMNSGRNRKMVADHQVSGDQGGMIRDLSLRF